jgi:hypothetical protein
VVWFGLLSLQPSVKEPQFRRRQQQQQQQHKTHRVNWDRKRRLIHPFGHISGRHEPKRNEQGTMEDETAAASDHNNEEIRIPLESLRQVLLDWCKTSDQNVRSTLSFLQLFKKVHMLNGCYSKHPDLKYASITNRAGRNLLESRGHDGDSGNSSGSIGNNKPCLPSSVWPILLERAQVSACQYLPYGNGEKATGLYYLLREGPMLLQR